MPEIWKKYDQAELTHSSAHHLMAIYTLIKENGYARGIDIARYLNITRGSVSITISKLKSRGYIQEDQNHFYRLTPKGQTIVDQILSVRQILIRFFTAVLGISPEQAEEDACKIEHLLSPSTAERIMQLVGLLLSDETRARDFQKDFSKFIRRCQQEEYCEICGSDCYLAGEPIHLSKR